MFRKLYGSVLVLFSLFLMTTGGWSQTSIFNNSVPSSLITCGDSDTVRVDISSFTEAKLRRNSYNEFFFFVKYNRWGEKVFETNDPAIGWDGNYKGKPAQAGVYVFYLSSTTKQFGKITRKGDITLIR
jgi:hypothetical protein